MKLVVRLIILGLVALPVAVQAQTIRGSEHDFSSSSWNTTGEICVVCHTPHKADITVTDAPLWNHQVTSATYTLYSSSTLQATLSQPEGSSKLCLSCHDGTIAIDNFGGRTTGTNFIAPGATLGTDLRDDHPVSFTYNTALANLDHGLYDPNSHNSGLGGTIKQDLLFSDKLQCASCHDVHNSGGLTHLLRVSNAASALCLTCHNK